MTIDMPTVLRRGLAGSAALLVLAATLVGAPAHADPPETWEDTQREAPLSDLIFLIGVPLLAFALIALLVYLPSMIRRQREEPASAFQDEPEWFGGPRTGVEGTAGASLPVEESRGGAGARW